MVMASPCNELMSNCDGINEEIVELYEECTDLNFQPYTYTENNEYFVGDVADQAKHFFNRLQVDSHYYTDDQFNRKCHTNADSDNFALTHYNYRSIANNFTMIRDHIATLDSMFDVIALSETWLNDNDSDSFNLDGYDRQTDRQKIY